MLHMKESKSTFESSWFSFSSSLISSSSCFLFKIFLFLFDYLNHFIFIKVHCRKKLVFVTHLFFSSSSRARSSFSLSWNTSITFLFLRFSFLRFFISLVTCIKKFLHLFLSISKRSAVLFHVVCSFSNFLKIFRFSSSNCEIWIDFWRFCDSTSDIRVRRSRSFDFCFSRFCEFVLIKDWF